MILCAGAGARLRAAPPAEGPPARKKPAPLYTDDDLRRVSPLRDQTGGGMQPAARPPETAAAPDRTRPGHDEAYWRGEAERLRSRLETWRDRAAELRSEIDQRRRSAALPRGRPDTRVESLQRRLAALEERIKEAADRFDERARRAGALPGWLR
jgi:hypothetical protein